ncbi:ABC transporter ATP-binding protein [Aquibacillus albus]|uniref:NitT/TauT family transport system ATP-binding protein n=1 Tax=Aquibacillus albus TaxID=1168171 RepID=A0ABS2N3S5_9BACI|nr:ABC transporter ATP-binding protein [Aquibacillus albus]MBM7572693.1 NitT/TauT family transport system ATP-binding protein [Aquibacillus albus]
MDVKLEYEEPTVEVSVRDVDKVFKGKDKEVTALKQVSFNVHKNEVVSLLGPSGCGKSTLLRLMTDLLQPTSGSISIEGNDPKYARLQRKLGIIFQTTTLFEWRNVKENIELPLEIMGKSKRERSETALEMLELVGLSKFMKQYPRQLSGGMQQRVAIARALSLDPPILFMDEPFSALDEFTKEKLHLDLMEIKRKTKKTIIFVTHSIPEAVFLSDRIIVLSAHPGRIHSIFEINLGYDRKPEIRETKEFFDYITQVRSCFYEEGD